MARALVWIIIAAVITCAGCGGGSTNKRAAPPVQVGPTPMVAKDGEFRTIIPSGYKNMPSVAQYWATGPEEKGIPASVIVVRQRAGGEINVNYIVRRTLSALPASARRTSHVGPASVNGEHAVSLDYSVAATGSLAGKVTHVHQVIVEHGTWLFFIRDIALPAQYPASLSAFEEVLSNWRWQ